MRTLMLLAALSMAGLSIEARQPDDGSSILLGRTKSGLMTVPVTVLGKPFTFLVDTGSARSVLSKATAQQVGLSVYPGARMIGTTGTRDVGQTWVNELRVGSVTLKDHLVVVADLDLLGRYDIKVDGILGADVLVRGQMRLDFARGQLWLSACKPCRPSSQHAPGY